MALDTFTPALDPSHITRRDQVSLWKPDFGVGFSRSQAEGINPIRQEVKLSWEVLPAEDASTIYAFAENHGRDIPFSYRAPDDVEALQWVADDWSLEYLESGYRSVSMTLVQVFDF